MLWHEWNNGEALARRFASLMLMLAREGSPIPPHALNLDALWVTRGGLTISCIGDAKGRFHLMAERQLDTPEHRATLEPYLITTDSLEVAFLALTTWRRGRRLDAV